MTAPAGSPLRRVLRSGQRMRILDALRLRSPLTLPELAGQVGLPPNTARDHLAALIRAGWVTARNESRAVRGRPRKLYAMAQGLQEGTAETRERTRRATAIGRIARSTAVFPPTREGLPVAAGQQLDVLEDHLERAGFRPEAHEAALTIGLCCPLTDVRDALPETVCAVDLCLIQSVLARVDGPLRATGITPIDPGSTCRVDLVLAHDGRGDDAAAAR
ncbi:helix-turn-helix domain-containing protein [Leifsonia xyli]|uniref:helix-turn-helix domain-containing protein n=1 Tax=Leifsonia xyli TaxID=1575 RepID=UPI003D66B228